MENSNNGLTNKFYKIKPWVKDVDDLAESLELDGYQFNILKSLFGMTKARHDGTSPIRDSNKMIHYSMKNKVRLLRANDNSISIIDVIFDIYSNLDESDKSKLVYKIKNEKKLLEV